MDCLYVSIRERLWLAVRAVLFGLLLALPTLLESYYYATPSDLAFNDGDESVYLALPYAIASKRPANSFYFELDTATRYSELLSELPSAPLDLGLGVLATSLDLGPPELGSLLDLIVTTFCYFLFAYFFSRQCSSRVIAETATAVLIGAPWLLSPYHFSVIDYSQFESFAAPLVLGHTAVATLRGVHTQISYPLFAFALLLLLGIVTTRRSRAQCVALGLVLGLLSYTYVFAWLSALSITAFTFLILLFAGRDPGESSKVLLGKAFLVFALQTLVAVPSLLLAFRVSSLLSESGFATPLLSEVGYFSFEVAALFLLSVGLLCFLKSSSLRVKSALIFIAATTAAEFPLMNLQALSGKFMAPVHFPVFYLHPLLGGLLFCVIGEQLFGVKSFRKAALGVSALVFALVVVGHSRKVLAQEERRNTEFAELLGFLKAKVPTDNVLAWLPYSEPFTEKAQPWKIRSEGNYLSTLSGIHLLYQNWQENVLLPTRESFSRELLTAWVFSGEVQTIAHCNSEITIFTNDMYFRHWISAQNRRRKICEETKEYREEVDACSLLAELRVDYALLETDLGLSPSRPLEQYGERVWQSGEGKYTLYRFDRELAMRTECEQKEG